ncbi:unnamed protein product, partial [Iphiclides podalirius]
MLCRRCRPCARDAFHRGSQVRARLGAPPSAEEPRSRPSPAPRPSAPSNGPQPLPYSAVAARTAPPPPGTPLMNYSIAPLRFETITKQYRFKS